MIFATEGARAAGHMPLQLRKKLPCFGLRAVYAGDNARQPILFGGVRIDGLI